MSCCGHSIDRCFQGITDNFQPSATGQNWEKYQKTFADDEIEEKKITPLTDEYACSSLPP
jgi:hypothetical protein